MSYIANQGSRALVLKCAIKKANGMGAWCDFSQGDWKDVIRPNEDEIGVFIQGSQDLPYEPGAQASLSTPSTKVRTIMLLQLCCKVSHVYSI